MRGVVVSHAPGVAIVDLTHEIEPGAVADAAFALLAAYPHFPAGTIHVVVVDPGVGSERRGVVVEAAGQVFVGPDNGVFSYLLDREADAAVRRIADFTHARQPMSQTFHGRDLFAPIGAAIARGAPVANLGPLIDDAVRLAPLRPGRDTSDGLRGRILHIDRFGNCVTNLTREDLPDDAEPPRLNVAGAVVAGLRTHYAGAPAGEPFLVEGSSGFLEVSVNGGSAAALMGVRRGDAVDIGGDSPPAGSERRWLNGPSSGSDPLELPVRCSVAAVVRRAGNADEYLAVRRPPDDDRLPDVWGLPAVTLQAGELPEEGLRRLGHEKLGVQLQPVGFVGIRAADRGDYLLILMDLEARVEGGEPDVLGATTRNTAYVEQQWTADLTLLADAARRGSVCSRILLESAGIHPAHATRTEKS